MVAGYKPWALLLILSSVKLRCLVFQIIVFKNIYIPCHHEYIYLKSYGLDSISCTVFVRVMGYKSLFSTNHDITSLLVCVRGVGEWGQ